MTDFNIDGPNHAAMCDRINDQITLAGLIYKYFYGMRLAGAKFRIAKVIQNYALGRPLFSDKEILEEFLLDHGGFDSIEDEGFKELKAEFWKQKNGASEPPVLLAAIRDFCAAKQLEPSCTDFFKIRIANDLSHLDRLSEAARRPVKTQFHDWTEEQLRAEADKMGAALKDRPEHGGSPGEWAFERLGELDTEARLRGITL